MSSNQNIENVKVRTYAPINGSAVTFGLATVTKTFDVDLVRNASKFSIVIDKVSMTAGTFPSLSVWLKSIKIIINQNEMIVPEMDFNEYITLVQNPEFKETHRLSPGGGGGASAVELQAGVLWKKFHHILGAGNKITVEIVIDTLANSFGGSPTAATAEINMHVYDSLIPAGQLLTYYSRIGQFPPTAGLTINAPVEKLLGTQARVIKIIHLLTYDTNGAVWDIFYKFELLADGAQVATLGEAEMAHQYDMLSDGCARVGLSSCSSMIAPSNGFNASAQRQLNLRLYPKATNQTGYFLAWEVFTKPFLKVVA